MSNQSSHNDLFINRQIDEFYTTLLLTYVLFFTLNMSILHYQSGLKITLWTQSV